jgi:hypothetical protein
MSHHYYDDCYYRLQKESQLIRESFSKRNKKSTEEILEDLGIKEIDAFLRKKKLKNINNE